MEVKKKLSYSEALKILSERESEVLALVGKGYSNKKIAAELSISVRTVQAHRNAICNKLGIHGRGRLTKWYVRKNSEN
ncbi:MAG: LuxR C-terminal-related transcriptional regulator [Balneolaceae bacterium]